MNLLVAGRHALFMLDPDSEQRVSIHEGGNLYFAITWDHDFIYFGYNRGGNSRLGKMKNNLEPLSSDALEGSAGNQHGAIWFNGNLYWTMPARDSVYIGDEQWVPDPETPQEWQARTKGRLFERLPKFVHGKRVPRDASELEWQGPGTSNIHHYNSIYVDDAGIILSSHNRGESEIVEYGHDRARGRRYRSGQAAHTVWRHAGDTHWIDSGNGQVKREGRVIYDAGTKYFPRGIAFDGEHYYLGLSERRERSERDGGVGTVRVLTASWEFVKDIEIANCGQIHEIRALCSDAVTHNGLAVP